MSSRRKVDAGWLAVQRERYGPDYSPEPRKQIRQAGELVGGIMKKMGLEAESRVAEISEIWKEVAGASNAEHSRPGRWEKGILTVYVDHPVWMSEMKRFATKALEKRLQKLYGVRAVKRVRFELEP